MRDIDPAAYDAFILSLVVAGQQGNLDEARQSRDEAAQGIAQLPPEIQQLAGFVIPFADGIIAFYEDDYEGALQHMEEARALNDGVSPSVLEFEALIELGRTDEALEALDVSEKGVKSARHGDRFNRVRTYVIPYYRGRAYEKAGETEAAIAAYQATIDKAGGGLRELVVIRDAPDRMAALEAAK
jgi:tetratricopeptide (TPR) repeat protein